MATTTPLGESALHKAARDGNTTNVGLLLRRDHADPNAIDHNGWTPLIATCKSRHPCVDVVRLLLKAGADPATAGQDGITPLHWAALHGRIDIFEILYSRAPANLNHCAAEGETPLYFVCEGGNEDMVSKIISLGAVERMSRGNKSSFPLAVAVRFGFMGVMRILFNEMGIGTVASKGALLQGFWVAIQYRQKKPLVLLLTFGGKERRSELANLHITGRSLVHIAAPECYPAAVSILLEAGADEIAHILDGRTPQDAVGLGLQHIGAHPIHSGDDVAIRRMLDRGPAYRARSWAWPFDELSDATDSADSDDDIAATLSPSVVFLRIFMSKEKNGSSKFFVTQIGR